MGLSGLSLVIFAVMHLIGNLLLLNSDPLPFNTYAFKLEQLGDLLKVLELGLLVFFVMHVVTAISVSRANRRARSVSYTKVGNAGGSSRKTLAALNMYGTGLLLLAFIIWHLLTFKWGPGAAQGYITSVQGQPARDLYRLVSEIFAQPAYMLTYVAIMGFFGLHLRHGFWSAFQSLGVNHPRFSPIIYTAALGIAALLGIGFMLIPIWVYFRMHGL